MSIDKAQIVQLLRSRGEDEKASQAEADLPDEVDTGQDADLLEALGIDPVELEALLETPHGGLAGGFG